MSCGTLLWLREGDGVVALTSLRSHRSPSIASVGLPSPRLGCGKQHERDLGVFLRGELGENHLAVDGDWSVDRPSVLSNADHVAIKRIVLVDQRLDDAQIGITQFK